VHLALRAAVAVVADALARVVMRGQRVPMHVVRARKVITSGPRRRRRRRRRPRVGDASVGRRAVTVQAVVARVADTLRRVLVRGRVGRGQQVALPVQSCKARRARSGVQSVSEGGWREAGGAKRRKGDRDRQGRSPQGNDRHGFFGQTPSPGHHLPYGQGGSACSSAGSQVACWAAAPAAESRSVAAAVIVVRIMMSVLVLGVGAASSSVAAGAGALWLVLWLCCGRCGGGRHRGSLRRHLVPQKPAETRVGGQLCTIEKSSQMDRERKK
jgi:hypothetical protein